MNVLTKIVVFIILFSVPKISFSQSNECGFDKHRNTLPPQFHQASDFFESKYTNFLRSGDTLDFEPGTFEDLPVIFHIVHEGDSLGSVPNPRVETVKAMVKLTNDIFGQKNSQQNSFENPYYGADTEISFTLATRDENNISTSGILRHVSAETGSEYLNSLLWNREKYINVFFLTNFENGFCGLYGSDSDFIRIDSKCASSSILAHELGHYLGLTHTFGLEEDCNNSDCLLTGDRVCDTPPKNVSQTEVVEGYEDEPCTFPANSCTTDEDDTSTNNPYRSVALGGLGDQPDPNSNIMGYTSSCSNNFTQGQALKMKFNLFENREILWRQSLDPAIFINDASIGNLSVVDIGDCNSEIVVSATITNVGLRDLNSAILILEQNNVPVDTIEWEGELTKGESRVVTFKKLTSVLGRNRLSVQLLKINNTIDDDSSSDIDFIDFNHFDIESPVTIFMKDQMVCQAFTNIGIALNSIPDDLHFQWRRENGTIPESDRHNATLIVDRADTYYLTIYSKGYTCSMELEATITFPEEQLQASLKVQASKLVLDCDAPSVTLRATSDPAATQYKWYSSSNNQWSGERIDVTSRGTYSFEAIYQTEECDKISVFSDSYLVDDIRGSSSFSLAVSGELDCSREPVFITPPSEFQNLDRYEYHWSFQLNFNTEAVPLDPINYPDYFMEGDPRRLMTSARGIYYLDMVDRYTQCSYRGTGLVNNIEGIPLVFLSLDDDEKFHNDSIRSLFRILTSSHSFVYEWSSEDGNIIGGAETIAPTIQGYGTYTAVVRDTFSNCESEFNVPLLPSAVVSLDAQCIQAMSNQKITVEASIEIIDLFDVSIYWFDANHTLLGQGAKITILEPGDYYTEVVSGSFSKTQWFTVDDYYFIPPQAIIDSPNPIECLGQELVLNGHNSIFNEFHKFVWLDGSGRVISQELTAVVDRPGIYSLQVQNTNTGCFSIAQVEVEDKMVQAIAGNYQVLDCLGKEVFIGQNENLENHAYSWHRRLDDNMEFVGEEPNISVNQPGIYILEVRHLEYGCFDLDSVEIYAEQDFIDVEIFGANGLCKDATTLLTIENLADLYSYELNWIFPDGSESSLPLIQATEEGVYTVEYFDLQTGCEYADSINIEYSFSVTLQIDTSFNSILSEVVGGMGPYTYNWSNGSQDNFIENPEPGQDYSVTVTDANGCVNVQHITYPMTTAVIEPKSEEEIKIYPNPSTGLLVVQLNGEEVNNFVLKIYNSYGNEVFYNRLSESQKEIHLNLQSNPAGVYIMSIDLGRELILQKFVLVR